MAKRLSELPVGAKVKDLDTKYNGKPIVWKVMGQNHPGDPAHTTALVTECIISLKCFDAPEKNNSDGYRRLYGNGRYLHSNLRQWLNSEKASWYSSQHGADEPPTAQNVLGGMNAYSDEAGFLSHFSRQMLDTIQSVKKQAARCSADGGGYDMATDRIFLLSNIEVGIVGENGTADKTYELFKRAGERICYPTAEAVASHEGSDSNLSESKPYWWWIRAPFNDLSFASGIINMDGRLNSNGTVGGESGVRPACVVKNSKIVSGSPDEGGVYTFLNSEIITDLPNDLGIKSEPFNINFKAENTNNIKEVYLRVYIDEGEINKVLVDDEAEMNINLSGNWVEILNGNHTIKLVLELEGDVIDEKSFAFQKNETKIEFEFETPLQADDKIEKALINLSAEMPEGAKMTVEACNNAFDALPTWENVTNAVKSGLKIFFKNQTKTADKWGFNVRVKIYRNNTEGKCCIKGIGGNFE